jgi:hypothetical protein
MSAPSAWSISQLLAIAVSLAYALDASAEDEWDSADLRAALRDEGIDPDRLLQRLGRSIVEDESQVAASNTRLDALIARRNRWKARAELKRDTFSMIMQTLRMSKFVDTDFSASLRENKGGAVVVADEDVPKLPDEYVRTTRTPDKARIKEALLDGLVIEGAALTQGGPPILTIRKG